MDRNWVYRVITYLALTVVAVVVLTPSAAAIMGKDEALPGWMKKHLKNKIQLGLDLQGGLHLVYEVQVDKAVSDKADRLAGDLEEKLHKDKKVKSGDVRAERAGKDEIIMQFKNPADAVKVDRNFLKEYQKYL